MYLWNQFHIKLIKSIQAILPDLHFSASRSLSSNYVQLILLGISDIEIHYFVSAESGIASALWNV